MRQRQDSQPQPTVRPESAETDELPPVLDAKALIPFIACGSPLLDGLRHQVAARKRTLRELATATMLPSVVIEELLAWSPQRPLSPVVRWARVLDALAAASGREFHYLPGRRSTVDIEQIAVELVDTSSRSVLEIARQAGLATPGNEWLEGGAGECFAGLDRIAHAVGTAPVLRSLVVATARTGSAITG